MGIVSLKIIWSQSFFSPYSTFWRRIKWNQHTRFSHGLITYRWHYLYITCTTRREQHTRFSTPIWQESPGALSHPLLKAETDIIFKGFHFTTQEDNISKKNKSKILYRYIEFDDRGVFSRAVMGILSELCWKHLMCIFLKRHVLKIKIKCFEKNVNQWFWKTLSLKVYLY